MSDAAETSSEVEALKARIAELEALLRPLAEDRSQVTAGHSVALMWNSSLQKRIRDAMAKVASPRQ